MRAVIQRVARARVIVGNEIVGAVGTGLLVLLGVGPDDTAEDIEYLAGKMVNLRIFEDEAGKMNRSLLDIGGQALIVSQFTLWADTRKGRRPSFVQAAPPEKAEQMYEQFVDRVRDLGVETATGRFAAMMQVHLVNDGPVTILMDSRQR